MKTATLTLRLEVENDSKFVRGKTRARENIKNIKNYHLARYGKKKLEGWEYEPTFSCQDDADLDKQVYDPVREMANEAYLRDCFIETDVQEKGADRCW